jgi:hypothetical protein
VPDGEEEREGSFQKLSGGEAGLEESISVVVVGVTGEEGKGGREGELTM